MTHCDRPIGEQLTDEDLVAFTDGELPPAEAARVAAHLETCAPCRREAALLRESGAVLTRMAPRAASAGFAERAGRAAAAEPGAAPRGRLLALPGMRAAVAAAVVIVAVGGLWFARGSSADGLSAGDEEAIAGDLLMLANLEALEDADADELVRLADDLDVIDALAETSDG